MSQDAGNISGIFWGLEGERRGNKNNNNDNNNNNNNDNNNDNNIVGEQTRVMIRHEVVVYGWRG